MLIIFEGVDRTGKTTTLSSVLNMINNNKDFSKFKKLLLKFEYYPYINNEQEFFKKNYESLINIFSKKKNMLIFCDRFHFGEYVYGKNYRNYINPNDIFNIEKKSNLNNVILCYFTGNINDILLRDDNKSFYNTLPLNDKLDKIKKEIIDFEYCFNKTKITKKIKINSSELSLNEQIEITYNFIKNNINNSI